MKHVKILIFSGVRFRTLEMSDWGPRATGCTIVRLMGIKILISALAVSAFSFGAPPADPNSAAWDVLNKGLADGNANHRRQALAATGSIGPENDQAVKLVEDGLQDKDPLVRQTAATVLGEMKARQAIPYLREALGDADEVAFSAAKALADVGDSGGQQMFVDVLTGERKDKPGMVTSKIRDAKAKARNPEALTLMGAKEAAGTLLGPAGMGVGLAEEAFKTKGSAGKTIAVQCLAKDPDPYAVTLLEWALADDDYEVRAEAAKGLGKRGNKTDIPKLQFLLADPHEAVRTMAAGAIIRLNSKSGDGEETAQR